MIRRLRRVLAKARAFVFTRADDREFEEELAAHLDLLTEENVRRGMPPAEAHRAARIALGSVTSLKEQHRDVRALPSLSSVVADIVFATRLFRRQPALFSMTVAGVALAIGITTSVFSVVDAVMNRGFGVPAPESVNRLTIAYGSSSVGGYWLYGDYLALREAKPSLDVAAALWDPARLTIGDVDRDTEEPKYVPVAAVTGTFFRIMGGRPALGRTLADEDDKPGAAAVIVLSYAFWQSAFGGDRNVIGQTLRLQGELVTIVGVAARGFIATDKTALPVGWMSLTAHDELQARQPKSDFDRRLQPVEVFSPRGLLVSESRMRDEATAVVLAVAAARGTVQPDTQPRVLVDPLTTGRRDSSALALAVSVIGVTVGLIVLLAAANVANLLLASAAGRSREIGVRLTLGASRFRIVRQLLTESVLLGLLGGAAGVILAFWTAPILAQVLNFPAGLEVSPGWRVIFVSVLVTVAVGAIAGLAPARYGRRGELLSSINAETPSATSLRSGRLRSVLIGAQAAASIVLLVVAALLTRALVQVIQFDFGLQADRLIEVGMNHRRAATSAGVDAFLQAAQDRLRQLPGVAGVSLALATPFDGGYAPMRVGPQTGRTVGGYLRGEPSLEVLRNETSAEYFETIGVRVLRGRTYTTEEVRTTAPVAVISESLARRFWPDEDPIGSSLTRVWGEEIPSNGRPMGFMRKPVGTRVIGVVSETITKLTKYDSPSLYLPMDPLNIRGARIVVRTSGDPQGMIAAIRDAVKATDPSVDSRTVRVIEGVQEQMRDPQALAVVAGVFAVSTLVLAVIGLFGVTSFVVRQRRREVSIRLALGATGHGVVRLLLRDCLRPVLLGMTCGLFVAILAGHVIRGMLYGVSGHDPLAMATAAILLLAAATAAVVGPVRRALRVDPAEMLKQS